MNFEVLYEFEEDGLFQWRVTLDEPMSLSDFVGVLLKKKNESGKIVDSSNDFLLSYSKGSVISKDSSAIQRCGDVKFSIIKCKGTDTNKTFTIPLDI